MTSSSTDLLATGRRVIRREAGALETLAEALDGAFSQAVSLLMDARGRVIVSGMGKSAHIARKIAAKSKTMIGLAKQSLNGIEDGNLEAKYASEQTYTLKAPARPGLSPRRRHSAAHAIATSCPSPPASLAVQLKSGVHSTLSNSVVSPIWITSPSPRASVDNSGLPFSRTRFDLPP